MYLFVSLLSPVAVYKLYPIVDDLLLRYPSYKVSKRQPYIVKNLIKACMLLTLTLYALVFVFPYDWDNPMIKVIASMYVANDLVALLLCKLPMSTTVHHVVSCMFLVFAQYIDFKRNKEAQLLFYYTFFSACTFFVNLYLGLRLIRKAPTLLKICKYGYPLILVLNWTVQIWIALDGVAFWYIILLLFIINDDIVLTRWLWSQ